MDIETKEAVLKLAGYEVDMYRQRRQGSYFMMYEVRSIPEGEMYPVEMLAHAIDRNTAINLAYNTFLTRQNDVVETS